MNVIKGYSDHRHVPQTRTLCRFFQRGMCRFGNRCRNVHEFMENNSQASTSNAARSNINSRSSLSPKKSLPGSSPGFSSCLRASPNKPGPSTSSLRSNATPPSKLFATNLQDYGPGANSEEEAIALVQKAQSQDKSCGICFDVIIEKVVKRDQLFGILPNCNHCYCFPCIRKWRQSKEFELDVAKACPECRVNSDYVYPSRNWFEAKEAKDNFISKENARLQQIHCCYYKRGNGVCPFGNTCVYLHAKPNGIKVDVGPPQPRRRRQSNLGGDLLQQVLQLLNSEALENGDNHDDILDELDDDDDDFDYDFLDLDDPEIAYQYYDHGDIRRYIAFERLMNPRSDSSDDDDFPFLF